MRLPDDTCKRMGGDKEGGDLRGANTTYLARANESRLFGLFLDELRGAATDQS